MKEKFSIYLNGLNPSLRTGCTCLTFYHIPTYKRGKPYQAGVFLHEVVKMEKSDLRSLMAIK